MTATRGDDQQRSREKQRRTWLPSDRRDLPSFSARRTPYDLQIILPDHGQTTVCVLESPAPQLCIALKSYRTQAGRPTFPQRKGIISPLITIGTDLLVTANVFLLSLPTNLYPARYNENSDETTTLGTSPQAGSRGCGSAENAAKGERGDIEVSHPSLSVL